MTDSILTEYLLAFGVCKMRLGANVFGARLARRRITIRCTGAAKSGVFKWTIKRRRPVIDDVIASNNDR